ncbi:MAG: YheU family protein [Cellvibrionaceae bacterium]
MIIPSDRLSEDALQGLIEEFITREGTDYGAMEVDLPIKMDQVKQQLKTGEAVIVFESNTESINIMTKSQHSEWCSKIE